MKNKPYATPPATANVANCFADDEEEDDDGGEGLPSEDRYRIPLLKVPTEAWVRKTEVARLLSMFGFVRIKKLCWPFGCCCRPRQESL